LLAEQQKNLNEMEQLMATNRPDFMDWLTTEKYGGNAELMKRSEVQVVNQDKKRANAHAARKGLLIPDNKKSTK
jgi:hypothetical protein